MSDSSRYGGTPRRLLQALLGSLENTRAIAIGFVLGGFALIVLGWFGAATVVPYTVDGSALARAIAALAFVALTGSANRL